jgi:GntR family transcriptional regulator
MQITIDFRSGQPIYLQILEQIRLMIARGDIKPGDQLPTVRQLAADLRVNFNTVARAYHMLDDAGLISTQHGRGTYVWEPPSKEVIDRLRSQNLHEHLQQFVQDLGRLGFSLFEIEEEFNKYILTEKERLE